MDVHLLQNNFCFNNNFDACGYPKLYRSMGTKFCSFSITHHVPRHVITLLFEFVCLGMNLLVWTNLKILILARLVEAENFDWYLKISALLILTEVNKICKYWSLTSIPLQPPTPPLKLWWFQSIGPLTTDKRKFGWGYFTDYKSKQLKGRGGSFWQLI